MQIDEVLPLLDMVVEHGSQSRFRTAAYSARCPAHADRMPSLSITSTADGNLLMFCHAGCSFESILAALGIDATRRKWGQIMQFWREIDPAPPVERTDFFDYAEEYFERYEKEVSRLRDLNDNELLAAYDASAFLRHRRSDIRRITQ